MKKSVTTIVCALAATALASSLALAAGSTTLVISQVYGGGGNTGATYTNDFIELYNLSGSTVSLTGWTLQYMSPTGTTGGSAPNTAALSGSVLSHHYFLIQLGSGGANGAALPTPDLIPAIAVNMGAAAGKIALVNNNTLLSGTACPFAASVVDFVGYGTTANCFEGAGAAGAPSAANADQRKISFTDANKDSNNNNLDFVVNPPCPRNSATTGNPCGPVPTTSPTWGTLKTIYR